ncbi:hypothetical protein [Pectobacterium odoriferum]|nr:hypothetical protein [Pectobacterium odoriferum]
MKNAYRIYLSAGRALRQILGDILLIMALWEKIQPYLPGGISL